MREFTHRFTVEAPLAQVVFFHRSSSSLGAITPPLMAMRVHQAPDLLHTGDTMAFEIHKPWQMSTRQQEEAGLRSGEDYPAPVVDHAWARRRALKAYGKAGRA